MKIPGSNRIWLLVIFAILVPVVLCAVYLYLIQKDFIIENARETVKIKAENHLNRIDGLLYLYTDLSASVFSRTAFREALAKNNSPRAKKILTDLLVSNKSILAVSVLSQDDQFFVGSDFPDYQEKLVLKYEPKISYASSGLFNGSILVRKMVQWKGQDVGTVTVLISANQFHHILADTVALGERGKITVKELTSRTVPKQVISSQNSGIQFKEEKNADSGFLRFSSRSQANNIEVSASLFKKEALESVTRFLFHIVLTSIISLLALFLFMVFLIRPFVSLSNIARLLIYNNNQTTLEPTNHKQIESALTGIVSSLERTNEELQLRNSQLDEKIKEVIDKEFVILNIMADLELEKKKLEEEINLRRATEIELQDSVAIANRRSLDLEKLNEEVRLKNAIVASSQRQFRTALDAAQNAMIMVAEDGAIVLINKSAEELFQYSGAEFLTLKIHDLVSPRYTKHFEYFEGFIKSPEARPMAEGSDLFGIRKDGSEVAIEIGLTPISNSDGKFVMASVIDFTERKKMEMVQRRLLEILDKSPEYIRQVDGDGKILYMNQALKDVLGIDDFSNLSLSEIHPEESIERLKSDFYPELQSQGFARNDVDIKARDGTLVPVSIVGALHHDEQGKISSMSDIMHDMSSIQAAHSKLESAKLEMENFIYAVSHDLKSPLVTISGFARKLIKSTEDRMSDQETHYLSRIEKNAEVMGDLLSDLLEVSRVSRMPIRPEMVSIAQVVEETLRINQSLIQERKAHLELKELPEILCDKKRISQVFSNLIVNGIRYTPSDRIPQIEVGFIVPATFYVKDNGSGIKQDNWHRIFKIFERLAPDENSGTGIGLAIVKTIVEKHLGQVWIESTFGSGSTFYFSIGSQSDLNKVLEADQNS